MFNHRARLDDAPRPLQLRDFLTAIVFGIVAAGLLHTLIIRVPSVGMSLSATTAKSLSAVCDFFSRDCDEVSRDDRLRFSHKLATIDNFEEATQLLQWQGGSERSALRYVAIIRAMQRERWLDKTAEKPWEVTRDALSSTWVSYPYLAVASQCYWCSYHDSNMFEWFKTSALHDDYLKVLIEYTPHLFGQFEQKISDADIKLAMAVRQAMLASHGNRYGYLGKVLFDKKDWESLVVLVANTSSAAPIMDLDWNKLPRNIVELSWQQGVRAGDDLPSFTERLLRTGYRPALRWALWVVAEGESHPGLRRMRRHVRSYQALLARNLEFPLREGQTIQAFYTENWRKIEFDESTKRWVYRAIK